MFDINKAGKGAIRQENPDPRDYKVEAILGVGEIMPFNWGKGYDVEDEAGELKREHQGSSLSCVGQAWSKYQETLEAIEGIKIDLSAKDIYSRIFMAPSGGAYLADGGKLLVKRGVVKETSNPSYINGTNPTEAFMREILPASDEKAAIYGSKSYAALTHNSIDWIAMMIRDNKGVVSGFAGSNPGWGTADVRPPKAGETIWGHACFLKGACMRNGKKAIKFLNSWGKDWGENGVGYFYEDYLGDLNYKSLMYDLFTLIDKPNTTMLKIIKEYSKPDQYVLGTDGERRLIYNVDTLQTLHNMGVVDKNSITEVPDISIYPRGNDLICVSSE